LAHSVDFVEVSAVRKVVICAGADSGAITAVSLTDGSVFYTTEALEYRTMTDVAMSPDNVYIATPAHGVVVISLSQAVVTGHLYDRANGHSVPTKLLVNSGQAGQLIVGYKDGLLLVFDVDTRTVVRSMSGHSAQINTLHLLTSGHRLTSGQLISAADDQRAMIWNLEERKLLDEEEMWTTSEPRSCRVFDDMSNYAVNCYTLDSKQSVLYAGSCNGQVKLFSVDTGE